jgi:hypothetical protein
MKKEAQKQMAESLVKSVESILNRTIHHFDCFDEPPYREDGLEDAVIVMYGSQCGHWVAALDKDGNIITPATSMLKIQMSIFQTMKDKKYA